MKTDIYSIDKNIVVSGSQNAKQINIYNALGSMIIMDNNVSVLKKYDMNNYPTGYYYVKFVTDNETFTQKVLLNS